MANWEIAFLTLKLGDTKSESSTMPSEIPRTSVELSGVHIGCLKIRYEPSQHGNVHLNMMKLGGFWLFSPKKIWYQTLVQAHLFKTVYFQVFPKEKYRFPIPLDWWLVRKICLLRVATIPIKPVVFYPCLSPITNQQWYKKRPPTIAELVYDYNNHGFMDIYVFIYIQYYTIYMWYSFVYLFNYH